jgi:MSHA pilin protein MshD
MNRQAQRQRGVSLLELLLAIVVIGIAATGALRWVWTNTQNSADPQMFQQANAVARSYLEEVLLRSFCDPDFDPDADPVTLCPTDCVVSACSSCGGTGLLQEGSRPLFDDVCDYDGLADAGVVDQTGAPVVGLGAFNVTVTVDDSVTLNGLTGAAGQVVLVNVNVTHSGNQRVDVNLSGYRGNY